MSDSLPPPAGTDDPLRSELGQYLEQLSAEPVPAGLEYRAAVWAPFHGRGAPLRRLILSGAVVVALAVVLVFGATQLHRAPHGVATTIPSPSAAAVPYSTLYAAFEYNTNATQVLRFYSLATGLALPPVTVPAGYTLDLVGPYGSQAYFGFLQPNATGGTGLQDVELVKLTPGDVTVLQKVPPASFVDASADVDGSAYGWIEKGTQYSCSGNQPVGPNLLYVATGSAPAHQVATLANLGADKPWQFYSWTPSHLVLAQGSLGCGAGIFVDSRDKDFVDLSTGTLQGTDATTGTTCLLQAVSDNGTIACSAVPPAETTSSATPSASTNALIIISPRGVKHTIPLSAFGSVRCASMTWGDVSLSPDGSHATILVDPSTCTDGGIDNATGISGYIVSTATGAVQQISQTDSTGSALFPTWYGADTLIALGQGSNGANLAYWIALGGTEIRTVNLGS